MNDNRTSNKTILRSTAIMVALLGIIGSLYFMFNAGSNQKSILLLGIFTVWVLSPFIGLFLVTKISNRFAVANNSSFYWLMIILTIGSLVAYSGTLSPPATKPAFMFLIIPFVSWLFIATVYLIAKRKSNKSNNSNQN